MSMGNDTDTEGSVAIRMLSVFFQSSDRTDKPLNHSTCAQFGNIVGKPQCDNDMTTFVSVTCVTCLTANPRARIVAKFICFCFCHIHTCVVVLTQAGLNQRQEVAERAAH